MFFGSSYILMNTANENFEKEIAKSNHRLLTQFQIIVDDYFIGQVYKVIDEYFLDYEYNTILAQFFVKSRINNPSTIMDIHTHLGSLAVKSTYLTSIWLYDHENSLLLGSDLGLIYEALEKENPFSNLINETLITEALISDGGKVWHGPSEQISLVDDQVSLTMTYPLFSVPENRQGCAVFNMDMSPLNAFITDIFEESEGLILIVDGNGQVYFKSDEFPYLNICEDTNLSEDDINKIMSNDKGYLYTSETDKKTIITWQQSSRTDWRYISIIPIDILSKDVVIEKQAFLLLISSILFFAIIGVTLITTLLYRPLHRLVNQVKTIANVDHEQANEIKLIDNAVKDISLQMEEMKHVIHKNENLILHNICQEIIHHKINDEQDLNKRLNLVGFTFKHSYYSLLVVEMHPGQLMSKSVEERDASIYKIMDMIESTLKEYVTISIYEYSNRIVTLINGDDMVNLQPHFKHLIEGIFSYMGIWVNMSLGEVRENCLLLYKDYESLKKHFKYSFIYGYGQIFNRTTVSSWEANPSTFGTTEINHYAALLKAHKGDKAKEGFHKEFQMVKEKGYAYDDVQNMLMQLLRLIASTARSQELELDILRKKALMDNFKSIYTLDECEIWMDNLIDLYIQQIGIRDKQIDNAYMQHIIDFINQHIDQQISLNMVADAFQMSSGHLSRVFKKETGQSFTEYTKRIKMEKAAQLLVSHPELKIAVIGDKLGFTTSYYFSKVFKEVYGMTPVQYRKSKML